MSTITTTRAKMKHDITLPSHTLMRFLRILLLRWPDTIYLHTGRLFSIHIFDHSAAFDCRDILDAEKGMLEVYQKCTFIEIDTNLRKFSAIFLNVVFKEHAYY